MFTAVKRRRPARPLPASALPRCQSFDVRGELIDFFRLATWYRCRFSRVRSATDLNGGLASSAGIGAVQH